MKIDFEFTGQIAVANDQETANKYIPEMLQAEAVRRFVLLEPLLGPVDLWEAMRKCFSGAGGAMQKSIRNGIDWVIVGGETGPNARPMHPDWVRSLRDQCQSAGVPFYFIGWGEWATNTQVPAERALVGIRWEPGMADGVANEIIMYKVGPKAAGRLLDGREWNGVPV